MLAIRAKRAKPKDSLPRRGQDEAKDSSQSEVQHMIEFYCQSCGGAIKVPDSLAGQTGRCPSCGAAVTAPLPSAVSPAPVVAVAPATQEPMEAKIVCSSCGTANTAVPALGQTACGKCGADLLKNETAPTAAIASQPQAVPSNRPSPNQPATPSQVVKARIKLALIGLAVLAVAAWAVYNYMPGVKPIPAGYYTEAQLEQLHKGMTYEQVLAVFHKNPEKPLQTKHDDYGYYQVASWENPNGSEAVVYFTMDGVVNDTQSLNLP
jgi:predicted RNA-binding Zn-ribbon protein involved in translation (DUF1610 family)